MYSTAYLHALVAPFQDDGIGSGAAGGRGGGGGGVEGRGLLRKSCKEGFEVARGEGRNGGEGGGLLRGHWKMG